MGDFAVFSECSMPNLSDLLMSPPDKSFLLHQLIGAETGFPEKMLAYRRNFIRLADKAVRDYDDARRNVLSLIERQKAGKLGIADGRLLMSLITNNLEDCIVTARRLFGHFERVKSDATKFPVDKMFKRRVGALEDSIRDVRDGIIHVDEHICSEEVDAYPPPVLSLDTRATTLTIGDTTLSTEALSRAIRHLHGFACDFGKYQFLLDGRYKEMPKSGPLKR